MLRDDYPLGVPCWVDTFQPDPESAAAFYSAVFGWVFDAPAAGGYLTARLGEHRVAGIGQAPEGAPAFWCTYVRVDRVDFSLAQVAGEGGAVLAGPLSAGAGGSMGVVSDPAGVAFALCDQLGAERGERAEHVGDGRAAHAGSRRRPATSTARCSAGSSSRCPVPR